MAEDNSDLDAGMFSTPDVYADGIASVHILGNENFRTIFFTWVQDPVTAIYTRVVTAKIVRPRSSLRPGGYLSRRLAKEKHNRPPGNHRDDGRMRDH